MTLEVAGVLAGVAFAVGVACGLGWRRADREELAAENAELRKALRYIHRAALHHPQVGALARFVERVLEEPTGT